MLQGFFKDFKSKSNPNAELLNHVRKLLLETHIRIEDVFDKEIDIHPVDEDNNEPPVMTAEELRKTSVYSLNQRPGSRYSRSVSSARSLESLASNRLAATAAAANSMKRPQIDRLKLGNSEYRIGRIEYKLPANAHSSTKIFSMKSAGSSMVSLNESINEHQQQQQQQRLHVRTRFFLTDQPSGASSHYASEYDLNPQADKPSTSVSNVIKSNNRLNELKTD
jgi:hypothetical protein